MEQSDVKKMRGENEDVVPNSERGVEDWGEPLDLLVQVHALGKNCGIFSIRSCASLSPCSRNGRTSMARNLRMGRTGCVYTPYTSKKKRHHGRTLAPLNVGN